MRFIAGVVLTLGAVFAAACAAHAQSFQTALPLTRAERLTLETQLSPFLDFARPNELRRFPLPTGRVITMRAYRPVTRPGQQPCRGYRIDLEGQNGRTAVDGFRCRRADGLAWAIVEPEVVLINEEGSLTSVNPANPTTLAQANPDGGGGNLGLYGDVDVERTEPVRRAPPPLPPRRPELPARATAAATPVADPAASPAEGDESDFLARATAALQGEDADASVPAPEVSVGDTVAASNGAAEAIADSSAESVETVERIVDGAATDQVASETIVETATDGDVISDTVVAAADASIRQREVIPNDSEAAPVATVGFADRSDIVSGLEALDYLDGVGATDEAAVETAVDEFARDERFALPISAGELADKIAAALARSQSLQDCGGAPQAICITQ